MSSACEVIRGKLTCTEGSWKPRKVDIGYYSIGGNETTRTGQAIAPIGYYAENGILKKCRAGYYGLSEGLYQASCSGPCDVNGYFCPEGSVSPTMKACGSDDLICPAGTTAPLDVSVGFYTYDYTSFTLTTPGLSDYSFFSNYQTCKPGTYRNWTLSKDNNNLKYASDIITANSIPPCQYCPNGTYKATIGDSIKLCQKCDNKTSISTPTRVTCECTLVAQTGLVSHFDLSSGKCLAYSVDDLSLLSEGGYGTNTSITRYIQFECQPGYFCIDGVRYTCPPGNYNIFIIIIIIIIINFQDDMGQKQEKLDQLVLVLALKATSVLKLALVLIHNRVVLPIGYAPQVLLFRLSSRWASIAMKKFLRISDMKRINVLLACIVQVMVRDTIVQVEGTATLIICQILSVLDHVLQDIIAMKARQVQGSLSVEGRHIIAPLVAQNQEM
jgi:hypothetical protein